MTSSYNYLEGLERIDLRLQTNVDPNRISTIPRFNECGSSGTMLCYGTVASIRLRIPDDENNIDESLKLKILESFFSEACQIIRSNYSCRDIIVTNFTITAIYNTSLKTEIEDVINDLARIRSLISIIEKKTNIARGLLDIRMSACYSSLNMIVVESSEISSHFLWNGDAIITSHQMLDNVGNSLILINKIIWNNLSESTQKLFTAKNALSGNYEGNISNVIMNNWLDSNM